MKNIVQALTLCLVLSGCASTPAEVLQSKSHFEYQSKKAPKVTSECLAKASRNAMPALVAAVQEGATKDTYETVVNYTHGDGGTMAVFVVAQIKGGAKIDAYVTDSVFMSAGKDRFSASIVNQCL